MKRNNILGIVLITSAIVLSSVVVAADIPSKKSDPVDTPSVPRTNSTEAKAKGAEPVKWDQLDPKAIERSAKKAQSKSPFSAVSPER
jgi:hypothetical protein